MLFNVKKKLHMHLQTALLPSTDSLFEKMKKILQKTHLKLLQSEKSKSLLFLQHQSWATSKSTGNVS